MTAEFIFVTSVIVVAGFARGALGFGEAMIAMPLLALVLPLTTAAPLVALAAIVTSGVILQQDWRHVVLRAAAMLTIFGLLSIPAGIILLRTLDDWTIKVLLALVVLGFAVWSLKHPQRFKLSNDRWAPAFGIAAGLLHGAYNTSGPPLVIFATLRQWPPQTFRATVQTYSVIASVWVIAVHWISGLVTREILLRFVWAVPFLVIATLAGRELTRRFPTERFIRLVYFALIAIGIWLLISCLINSPQPSDTQTYQTTVAGETTS